MRWWREGEALISDAGYKITRSRMSQGWWHNAFIPRSRGMPIASGQLERCVDACERHYAGEIGAKTKRKARSELMRLRLRRADDRAVA